MQNNQKLVVFDGGNALLKIKSASAMASCRHAFVKLSEAQYQHVLAREGGEPPVDFLRVNGTPYCIGDLAENYADMNNLDGSARYTPQYYGVLMCAALIRIYNQSQRDLVLYASHSPLSLDYRDNLMDAALGEWVVEQGSQKLIFNVVYVNTFDEPIGGIMNVALAQDGKHYLNSKVAEGNTLVIDVGGFTTDFAGLVGGQINHDVLFSEPIGINETLHRFERGFRSRYKEEFMNVTKIAPDRIRQAIAAGTLNAFGRGFPCREEVNEAVDNLINRIRNTYINRTQSGAGFDTIVLTGGGSAMLYNQILNTVNHANVMLAEQMENAHYANINGGRKLALLLDSLNAL